MGHLFIMMVDVSGVDDYGEPAGSFSCCGTCYLSGFGPASLVALPPGKEKLSFGVFEERVLLGENQLHVPVEPGEPVRVVPVEQLGEIDKAADKRTAAGKG